MKKIIRVFSAFSILAFCLSLPEAYATVSNDSSVKKWDLSYSYELSYIDDEDDADTWIDDISYSSLRLGYYYNKMFEFGLSYGFNNNSSLNGDSHDVRSYDYQETFIKADIKLKTPGISISDNSSLNLYARGYMKYSYANCDWEFTDDDKLHQTASWYSPGYGVGIDVFFGKKKKFHAGLEYNWQADSYNGYGKLAKFDDVKRMLGVNIGWRFGKSTEKHESVAPLMNTVNGLPEVEWKRVTGGINELDRGIYYRPNVNFGSYGNNWFGH